MATDVDLDKISRDEGGPYFGNIARDGRKPLKPPLQPDTAQAGHARIDPASALIDAS